MYEWYIVAVYHHDKQCKNSSADADRNELEVLFFLFSECELGALKFVWLLSKYVSTTVHENTECHSHCKPVSSYLERNPIPLPPQRYREVQCFQILVSQYQYARHIESPDLLLGFPCMSF